MLLPEKKYIHGTKMFADHYRYIVIFRQKNKKVLHYARPYNKFLLNRQLYLIIKQT